METVIGPFFQKFGNRRGAVITAGPAILGDHGNRLGFPGNFRIGDKPYIFFAVMPWADFGGTGFSANRQHRGFRPSAASGGGVNYLIHALFDNL